MTQLTPEGKRDCQTYWAILITIYPYLMPEQLVVRGAQALAVWYA